MFSGDLITLMLAFIMRHLSIYLNMDGYQPADMDKQVYQWLK